METRLYSVLKIRPKNGKVHVQWTPGPNELCGKTSDKEGGGGLEKCTTLPIWSFEL